jgi:hypothetical protein
MRQPMIGLHIIKRNWETREKKRLFKPRSLFALWILPIFCTACTSAELWSTGGGHMLVTSADYRAINQTSAGRYSVHGRVMPSHITCAEPSPDVAKAISTALNVSGSGGVTLPNGVTADVAAAVSRARAEALVQLGERLATIQLLRDGLHSACEAFANGAITDTTYAVMLSRFDKTMVTMLATEIAGGAFGRSLAAAGMASEGHASATADLAAKIARTRELEQDLKNAQDAQNTAAQEAAALKDSGDAKNKTAQEKVDTTRKDAQKKEGDYKNALKAMTDSAAKVTQLNTAGSIAAQNNPEIAKTLADMQRKYIENLNFDALEVACISALDRGRDVAEIRAQAEAYAIASAEFGQQLGERYRTRANSPGDDVNAATPVSALDEVNKAAAIMATTAQKAFLTPLAGYCLSTVLPMIQAKKGELLNAIIVRAETLKDDADKRAKAHKDMKESVTKVEDYIAATKTLLEQVKALRAIEIK